MVTLYPRSDVVEGDVDWNGQVLSSAEIGVVVE